jgi:rhodanese-related sulfurtransferase
MPKPFDTDCLLIGEGGAPLSSIAILAIGPTLPAATRTAVSPTWRRCGADSKHEDISSSSKALRQMFLVLLAVRHMYGSSVSQGSNLAMSTEPLKGPDAISVHELADMRSSGKAHTVLDVREARELDVCRLEGALHIPMGQISVRTDELPTDQLLVVLCHHGARSQMIVDFLRSAGFDNAVNLDGGIDAWACDVDPSMPRYR